MTKQIKKQNKKMKLKILKKDSCRYIDQLKVKEITFYICENPEKTSKIFYFDLFTPINDLKFLEYHEEVFGEKYTGISSNFYNYVNLYENGTGKGIYTIHPDHIEFMLSEEYRFGISRKTIESNIDLGNSVLVKGIICKEYLTEFGIERFPADIDISKGKIDHELFFIDSKGINFKFETELVSGLFRFPVLDP